MQLCAILDHFGYPASLFSGWRQARWYNLHLTEVWLHNINQNIIDGCEPLPTIGAMLADLPSWEENVPESSPVTAPTNAVTSSSSPVLTTQPTVAHKEPQNHALQEQAVARLSALAPAVNPLGWILPVLPLPLMENEVGPHPGRVRTKSLNDAHCVQKPFPQWTLRPLRNMVPARLRKVTMTVIKGVYHGCFADKLHPFFAIPK